MTKTRTREEQEKQIKVEQVIRENEAFGVPIGLYHHINISGHAFQVEISCPANAVNFTNVVDFAQWLALFCSDETIRNMTKLNIKKMLENSEKEGDNDGE